MGTVPKRGTSRLETGNWVGSMHRVCRPSIDFRVWNYSRRLCPSWGIQASVFYSLMLAWPSPWRQTCYYTSNLSKRGTPRGRHTGSRFHRHKSQENQNRNWKLARTTFVTFIPRLIVEDKYTNARRSAVKVFGQALQSLAELFFKERYPDDEERQRFAARVRADVENPDYRLYTISYAISKDESNLVIPSSGVNLIFIVSHDCNELPEF